MVLTVSVLPPSVVSISWLPPVTVSRQVSSLEQSIVLKELPAAIAWASHFSPPLVVRRRVLGPIA